MIELSNASKFYYSKGVIATGFSKVNLKLDMGEFVAITGESGSGKSTLLNVISGLDSYEEGEMFIEGEETSHYTEKDFENYRRKYIGNIFQSFNLVNSYTVYQNIELVMLLAGFKGKEVKDRVNELIEKVGLSEYRNTKASKLSGGQKQRVAIARALAKDTPIIIADEPTGNLDSESAAGIIKLLSEIAADKLVVIVTHNYDQVEPYVTRKIKMHDGKIIEDVVLRKHKDVGETKVSEIDDIKPLPLLRLGVRNAFNIPVKFLLLVFVFLFIAVAITTELASFKSDSYENAISGGNYFFKNVSDKRVVVKKADGSAFSNEDIKKIQDIENVDYIIKNDASIDEAIAFEDPKSDFYFYGMAFDIKLGGFDTVDVGKMPEKENEAVLGIEKGSYELGNSPENLIGKTLNVSTNDNGMSDASFVVSGIKYIDTTKIDYMSAYYDALYLNSASLEKLQAKLYSNLSEISVIYEGKLFANGDNNSNGGINVVGCSKVPKGQAYCSENFVFISNNLKAVGKEIKVNVSNMYFEDSFTSTISQVFKKDNFNALTGLKKEDYDYMTNAIFVNDEDLSSMFNKNSYQMSVFVKDPHKVQETKTVLTDMGCSALVVTDATVSDGSLLIMKILSYSVTIGLAVALFFISYFVIRIILRSRNSYYSIVRMLGANVGVSRRLLILDLLTDANIACILTAAIILVLHNAMPNNLVVSAITTYMGASDYIAIYLIVTVISLLISIRYSSRLFKKSAINTFKEEV